MLSYKTGRDIFIKAQKTLDDKSSQDKRITELMDIKKVLSNAEWKLSLDVIKRIDADLKLIGTSDKVLASFCFFF